MADYYPLLARALEALPDRSPPMRKAVYDRARSALIGQLRSLDPPLSDADIGVESRALDSAIERLEVDFGGAPPAAAPAETAKPPPTPPPPEPDVTDTADAIAASPEPTPPEPPPLPEPDLLSAREAAPEPARQPDFVPFVPPRKAKLEPKPAANEDVTTPSPAPSPTAQAQSPEPEAGNGRRRPRVDVVPPKAGRSRLLRNAFVGAVLAVVIGLIAVAAFMLRDQPADLDKAGATQEALSEPPESKFADRIGGDRAEAERRPVAPKPSVSPSDVTVTQRAVLIEENTADAKAPPTSTTGRAIWRLEPANGEQGQPLQNAVRANVEFPDTGFSLTMTIRKNLDATLPASHTIDLLFTETASGEKRVVQEIGLLQLKDEENARGSPVSGLPVRVRDNFFLIGLSNLPNEVERNTELLTRKAWLDLPVKFKSGARAVLTFTTGGSGSQVIESAFEQWRD